jgi:hypothetical protein
MPCDFLPVVALAHFNKYSGHSTQRLTFAVRGTVAGLRLVCIHSLLNAVDASWTMHITVLDMLCAMFHGCCLPRQLAIGDTRDNPRAQWKRGMRAAKINIIGPCSLSMEALPIAHAMPLYEQRWGCRILSTLLGIECSCRGQEGNGRGGERRAEGPNVLAATSTAEGGVPVGCLAPPPKPGQRIGGNSWV